MDGGAGRSSRPGGSPRHPGGHQRGPPRPRARRPRCRNRGRPGRVRRGRTGRGRGRGHALAAGPGRHGHRTGRARRVCSGSSWPPATTWPGWPASQAGAEGVADRADEVERLAAAALGSGDRPDRRGCQPMLAEVYVGAPVAGATLEGFVDLLIDGPDGLIVVDYKTDAVRRRRARRHRRHLSDCRAPPTPSPSNRRWAVPSCAASSCSSDPAGRSARQVRRPGGAKAQVRCRARPRSDPSGPTSHVGGRRHGPFGPFPDQHRA